MLKNVITRNKSCGAKEVVYVSGKITGDKNFKHNFRRMEKTLVKRGFNVINPCKIGCYDFFGYEDYMHVDFALIDVADTIYMMQNWRNSAGARRELEYAIQKRKKILFDEGKANCWFKVTFWNEDTPEVKFQKHLKTTFSANVRYNDYVRLVDSIAGEAYLDYVSKVAKNRAFFEVDDSKLRNNFRYDWSIVSEKEVKKFIEF